MAGAMLGEMAQVLVRNPFELIKQNMQVGKYNSILEASKDILSNNGIPGFYRGYFVTVLREIPFGLIQYPLYEHFKSKAKENKNTNKILHYSICGSQAGAIAAFLTTPIDVIKTRIMTSQNKEFRLNRVIPTLKDIYNNEGFIKLFSGVHMRVLYITIGGMMFFGSNELFKQMFAYNLTN